MKDLGPVGAWTLNPRRWRWCIRLKCQDPLS